MKLDNEMMIIHDATFRVRNYEEGMKLQKGIAYRMKSSLHDYILPFRGKLKVKYQSEWEELPAGLYSIDSEIGFVIKYPVKKDRKHYSRENIKDLKDHTIFDSMNLITSDINIIVDGDIFRPEVRPDDDANNTIFKVGINLKDINIDQYGPRLEQIDCGTNVANRKSNAKKAIMNNNSMSSQKMSQYCPAFDISYAVIIANSSNAIHPMKFSPVVYFPGEEFDISNAVSIDKIKEAWDYSSKPRLETED